MKIKYLLLIIAIYSINLEATMKLISPAFSDNEAIPTQYTCDGANISPALAWADAPENTKSFALIVDDPDAGAKVWVHWVLFNIHASVNSLTENLPSHAFMQGTTDFGKQQYGGPCPPSGTHHYTFTLYALDTTLDLPPAGATKEKLLTAMHGHILEQATLIGTYQRKK